MFSINTWMTDELVVAALLGATTTNTRSHPAAEAPPAASKYFAPAWRIRLDSSAASASGSSRNQVVPPGASQTYLMLPQPFQAGVASHVEQASTTMVMRARKSGSAQVSQSGRQDSSRTSQCRAKLLAQLLCLR